MKQITIILFIFLSTVAHGQIYLQSEDSVRSYLSVLQQNEKNKLDSLRLNYGDGLLCANPMSNVLKIPYREQKRFIQKFGMISANDIYTLEMRRRVIQLLRKEYSELESQPDNMSHFIDRVGFGYNFQSLLSVCCYLNDSLINSQLIEMLSDTTIIYYHTKIRQVLAINGCEPYCSDYINENKYVSNDDVNVQLDKIHNLEAIKSEESILQLSNFLLEDKEFLVPTGDGYERTSTYHILNFCFDIITNAEYWNSIKTQNPWEESRGRFEPLSKEKAQLMYNWIQNNYGNYQLLSW